MVSRAIHGVLALVLVTYAGSRSAQELLAGQVIDGASHKPISGATVTLHGALGGTQGQSTVTNAQGRFDFGKVPPGRYRLTAQKSGYRGGEYGQKGRRSGGIAFEATGLSTRGSLDVPIWKFSAISGSVLGEHGEPIIGATVQVFEPKLSLGQWVFTPLAATKTDDQGHYRLSTLDPDKYLLATGGSKDAGARPTFFYPGVFSPSSAATIALGEGEERAAIDLRYATTTSFRLLGTLLGVGGEPVAASIELTYGHTGTPRIEYPVAQVNSDATGKFAFERVPPGNYTLRVVVFPQWDKAVTGIRARDEWPLPQPPQRLAGLPDGQTLWTEVPVSIQDRAPEPLELRLQPGFVVTGRVEFNGLTAKPQAPALGTLPVHVRMAGGRVLRGIPLGPIAPDGHFKTVGLPKGLYGLGMFESFPGWRVASIKLAGVEVAGRAFELANDIQDVVVTFTDQPAEVSGTVTDRDNRPRANVWVIAFPADRKPEFGAFSTWYRLTRSNADGQFLIRSFLPGRYNLVATDRDLPQDWHDLEFLDSLVSAAPALTINIGDKLSSNLRIR